MAICELANNPVYSGGCADNTVSTATERTASSCSSITIDDLFKYFEDYERDLCAYQEKLENFDPEENIQGFLPSLEDYKGYNNLLYILGNLFQEKIKLRAKDNKEPVTIYEFLMSEKGFKQCIARNLLDNIKTAFEKEEKNSQRYKVLISQLIKGFSDRCNQYNQKITAHFEPENIEGSSIPKHQETWLQEEMYKIGYLLAQKIKEGELHSHSWLDVGTY